MRPQRGESGVKALETVRVGPEPSAADEVESGVGLAPPHCPPCAGLKYSVPIFAMYWQYEYCPTSTIS